MDKNIQIKPVEKIKITLKKHKNILKHKYAVREIGIFGSYAKGKAKKAVIWTFW